MYVHNTLSRAAARLTLHCTHGAQYQHARSELLRARHLTAVLTPALFLEYEERLCGDATLYGLGRTDADLVAFLDELVARSRRVRLYWLWRPVAPDPDDDMVIECAVNGRAEVL
jgi:hypothetical protein